MGLTGAQLIEEAVQPKRGDLLLVAGAVGAIGRVAVYGVLPFGNHAWELELLVTLLDVSPMRALEIATRDAAQAKEISASVVRGSDFVAVHSRFRYTLSAPGRKSGSEWEQILVFPQGESTERRDWHSSP